MLCRVTRALYDPLPTPAHTFQSLLISPYPSPPLPTPFHLFHLSPTFTLKAMFLTFLHSFQFMPFGAGPRNCIGMRFALVEMKLTLVKIMRRFRLVRSPETQVPLMLHAGGTLAARDGVLIQLETLH